MEDADYQIGEAYGVLIKEIAIVHILSTATLEAHINSIAHDSLNGKYFDYFERLSLEAKWLYLPKLLGYQSFNPRNEPFQSFSRHIQVRNKLVHYKGMQEKWVSGKPPQFLTQIGLTLSEAEKAIRTAEEMIAAFADLRKAEHPFWLHAELYEMDDFGFEVINQRL
jgi:hypothetical protein